MIIKIHPVELAEQMEQPERDQYIANAFNRHGEDWKTPYVWINILDETPTQIIISNSFKWDETPEGWPYWLRINNKYKAKEAIA